MRIGILYNIIRKEEKLLIEAARKNSVDFELINVDREIFTPERNFERFDLILNRCLSKVKARYALNFFEFLGITTVNPFSITQICDDKFLTSLVLEKNKIPTLKFALVFNKEEALKAIEEKFGGFPVVLKPPQGSWGRLLVKINDVDCLEAIFEHKENLGGPEHKVFYLQEYIEKPGRDIRAVVIDGETICAIYRISQHWITNTYRGGKVSNCPITDELRKICFDCSKALGEGILAVDIIETKEGLKVNEINAVPEFRNTEPATGVSVSSAIINYCIKKIQKNGR